MKIGLFLILLIGSAEVANSAGSVTVTSATAPSTKEASVALTLHVLNAGGQPDAIVRANCDVSQFVGKFALDTGGEGDANARELRRLETPVGETVLSPETRYLKLLQLKQPLQTGETFSCDLIFSQAGRLSVPVHVVNR